VSLALEFEILDFEFVSDFGFEISDLEFALEMTP